MHADQPFMPLDNFVESCTDTYLFNDVNYLENNEPFATDRGNQEIFVRRRNVRIGSRESSNREQVPHCEGKRAGDRQIVVASNDHGKSYRSPRAFTSSEKHQLMRIVEYHYTNSEILRTTPFTHFSYVSWLISIHVFDAARDDHEDCRARDCP